MYHCYIRFYLVGGPCEEFEYLQKLPPLKTFTHEFLESIRPEPALLERADVILANLQNADAQTVLPMLLKGRKGTAECILLVRQGQFSSLTAHLSGIRDVWTAPMGREELQFRFLRWQQAYQAEQYQKVADSLEGRVKNYTLEQLFASMDWGVICHTLDGSQVLSVNRAALEILGYGSLQEMMDGGFAMVAPSVVEEDKPELRERIRSLTRPGESVRVKYRVRHKDGRLLHVMGSIKLIEEDGELLYQRFLLDITAQDHRQSELIQALSIDFNLVCMFRLDTGAGRALRIDDSEACMLDRIFSGKRNLEDCMERYISTCVHPEDRELVRRSCARETLLEALDSQCVYSFRFRTVCRGEVRYYLMKAVRTGFWRESRTIVLGLRNVDGETRSEMEQKSLLEDALSQANRASKAKSVFLSNMSHDIRTPMNAIVGFTTLAITHIDQKEQVEAYLKKILTSGNHLVSLINDVLDMSRIESGKTRLEEALCSLPDILQGLRSIVQGEVQSKRLELYIDAADVRNKEIYCDRLRLNQVLLNLLGNSIKYTGAGGTVSLRIAEKPGAPKGYANYEFTIKDTGIGMSPEFMAHIFEPFERESSTTTSGIQGTGLGMAITKNLVDMMNGTIEVRSEQGAGTEFTVALPFRLYDGSGTSRAAPAPQGGACPPAGMPRAEEKEQAPARRHTGRILLAEDNELNQEIAATILEEAGFTVEVAGNGRLALEMLQKSRPGYYQLILMDVQMPVMDGYAATREIRRLENRELASTPILAMTANAFEEDRQNALRCGMNGHIAKPIDIDRMFETLDGILV